jgi:Sulfotransferase family
MLREDERQVTPFIFFVGTNGSGTTLHRAIFDSHPEVAIPGEGRFVAELASRRGDYEGEPFDVARFVADISGRWRFENWGLSREDAEAALTSPTHVTDFPDAVRRLYHLYATLQGKTRYGDKTQSNIHDLTLLGDLFPEARFVHVVRDGRDVALAHTDGKKVEQVAISWRRRVGEGRVAGASLGPQRYTESRYEELVEDPESSVRRLCDFLDLAYHPQMLEYHERADQIVGTTASPKRHTDIYLPPTKGLRNWRSELTPEQVARFEALAGGVLSDLGYERAFDRIPIGSRLAAWGRVGADSVRYVARRAS